MKYKYSRLNLFGKKLDVPKDVQNKIYSHNLSLKEYITYDLIDKVPFSCLSLNARSVAFLLGKDGLLKLKTNDLDLDLVEKYNKDISISLFDISDPGKLPDNFIEIINQIILPQTDSEEKGSFLKTLLKNQFHLDSQDIEKFISNYGDVLNIFINNASYLDDFNVKNFVGNIIGMVNDDKEIKEYFKHFTDKILDYSDEKYYNYGVPIILSNDEYKTLFNYSSLEEHLLKTNHHKNASLNNLIKELESLPKDYIFNIPFPLSELFNYHVINFVGTYGLKNVVDFDNECGHFFTKNNSLMLKLIDNMYLHYDGIPNSEKTVFTKSPSYENGIYVDRPYTKDEFYEAMRRMIIYGPNNSKYADKAPDYRNITGEFRTRNAELFISEQAPEELQKLFYTKSITPKDIAKHPEYIQYLDIKDLGYYFKFIDVSVYGSNKSYNYENFYNFIKSKTDFSDFMDFIVEYSDVLEIVFDIKNEHKIDFSVEDDIGEIQKKINATLKDIIIEKGIAYPKTIPQSFIDDYPSMFLSNDAPEELKNAFYDRTINTEFILSNPEYKNYLKNIDLEVIYKYMPVDFVKNDLRYGRVNLINIINQVFADESSLDIMLMYGKYIESIFEINKLKNFVFNYNFSKEELLNEIDSNIYKAIVDEKLKYDENIPEHFKKDNPTLFLPQNVSLEIKNKFYNREFSLEDFNFELLEMFGDTNVVCGFSEDVSWMIPLFKDSNNFKEANANRLKIISTYSKIQDVALQKSFKEYIIEFGSNVEIEKLDYVSEVLSRLSFSNSSEIFNFRKELATQILKTSNPLECLSKIEDVFIKNNIPTVGKIYSCFDILHPDFRGFDFEYSNVSPFLKSSSTMSKKIIVFSDLIKSSFGSNNRSVNAYIKNIEVGSKLYESIRRGNIQYENLSEIDKNELIKFSRHLATLYNNTMKGKKDNNIFMYSGNVIDDISELSKKISPDGSLNYNIADRVIRMFCGFAGIDTLAQAKNYINNKLKTAEKKNREASRTEMVLEQGDFVKGIGNVEYLRNILQNGSVSKEYLGASAGSDATPLDTDISMILTSDGTVRDKICSTSANGYGPIWFVLKNDDRFVITRTDSEDLNKRRDLSKMEVFYTGVLGRGHYGIRTGFASSEINYIVVDNYDPRVALEIAMNGFYIPIANKDGKIMFTPEDYDMLREKMSGLSHFDENDYSFSDSLITKETEYLASQIEQSNHSVRVKREKINEIIRKSLGELGLELKSDMDGDLTEGFVELIDTGSTGRGTNKPGDGDFDFMMRIDKKILSNPDKMDELKEKLLKNLGVDGSRGLIGTGDFRLKDVSIDEGVLVDIDITFTEKTDKISYSTDMALKDRLATIQKNDPEKYKYVVANILLAKQVLKEAGAYKPNRGEVPQGGLGGVGIENWILQNGGSFIDAAKSFVEASEGKSFEEFQLSYQIWDFGDNYLAERRGQYCHDNFVSNNMSEIGYKKMVHVLKEYLNKLQVTQVENIKK